jgi:DNA-binding transcriptional LysR family regulator
MFLDPRHLEQLSVIVDKGTFQAAATELNMTQPALSRMVATLEARIGMPVFKRTKRPLRLTDIGYELSSQGRVIRSARLRALEFVDLGKTGFSGVLKVGAPRFLCERLMTETIASFIEERPEVRIDLIADYYTGLQEQLFQNKIDIILGPAKMTNVVGNDLAIEPLFDDQNRVVGREGHPLLNKKEITIQDLSDAIWIAHSERSVLRTDMENALKLLGVKQIRLAFQTEAAGAVLETLRITDFLTVLPSYAIHTSRPSGLKTLPIDLPTPINTVNMITLNDQLETKLLVDFKEHVRQQIALPLKER